MNTTTDGMDRFQPRIVMTRLEVDFAYFRAKSRSNIVLNVAGHIQKSQLKEAA